MFSIAPKKALRILLLIIIGISLIDVVLQYSKFFLGHERLFGLANLLDVDSENSLPNWYSSITLFICAALLFVISLVKKQEGDRYSNHWKWLSVIFLYISLDESAGIHELLIDPLRDSFHLSGFLYYPWVIVAGTLVVTIFFIYLKFLFALPVRTRFLFLLAGAIYIMGAAGFEMIGGEFISTHLSKVATGWEGFEFHLFIGVEEFLEKVGVGLFIYALLEYISDYIKEVRICVSNRKSISNSRLANTDI